MDSNETDTAVEIASPTVADIERLADFWVELARDQLDYDSHLTPDANRELVRDTIAHHVTADGILVARTNGDDGRTLVGFVMFSPEGGEYVQDITRGVIQNLYVVPDHRGKGVGGQLLAAAEARLRITGIDAITLDAMAANDGARRFYERHGYEVHRVELEKRVESDNTASQDS